MGLPLLKIGARPTCFYARGRINCVDGWLEAENWRTGEPRQLQLVNKVCDMSYKCNTCVRCNT